MKQYEFRLPEPAPGTVKRLLKVTSGRELKMAGDTTNATMMLENGDRVHLFDIDADGNQNLNSSMVVKANVDPKWKSKNKSVNVPRIEPEWSTEQHFIAPKPVDKPEGDSPEQTPEKPAEDAPVVPEDTDGDGKVSSAEKIAAIKARLGQS